MHNMRTRSPVGRDLVAISAVLLVGLVTGCEKATFTIGGDATEPIAIRIAPNGTRTLSGLGIERTSWPQVGIRDRSRSSAQCEGASLTLRDEASGRLEH